MKKLIPFLVFFTITYFSNAQQKYKNSEQLMKDGYLAVKDEDYNDAIEAFSQVNKNDDKYFEAQYEISLCHYFKKNYDSAIAICKTLIADDKYNNENASYVYVNMGNAYNKLEKSVEAIKVAEEGIKKYPMYYLLYYNKAVYHKSNKELQLAIDNLEKAIFYNPNYYQAHVLLGQIAAEEGMLVQAMLCFNTCIFLKPDDKNTLNVLQYFNTAVSKKYESKENNLKFSPTGDDFKDIEDIIRAQASLNSKYKLETDVDFPFIRQNQALFSYLQNHTGKDGFFEKYYVPFYKEIYAKKYFNAYTFLTLLSSDNESVQGKVKKNLKSVTDFYKWASDQYILTCGKRKIDAIDNEVYFFYNDGDISRIGNLNDKLESEGTWIYTYENGLTNGIGEFKNNKAVGEWKFYYMNQKLKETKIFDNEIKNGLNTFYHDNGTINETSNYKLDSLDGPYEGFNYYGAKLTTINFENNKKNGTSYSYYLNGNKHFEMNYKNNDLNGTFISYYPTGAKEYEVEMKDNKKNGKFTNYFLDGKVSEEYLYKEGYSEGPYKLYYRNGQVKEEGTYKKGRQIGTCKYYYTTGKVQKIKELDADGNESGITKDYDYDGVLFSEMMKSKKKILSLKYYNKLGQVIYESKVKDNEEVSLYRPDGTLAEKGKALTNNKDGLWTEYYRSGKVSGTVEYKNGFKDGQSQYFFKNGQLKSSYYYKRDSLVGTYEKYFINGQLYYRGHSYDDHLAGLCEEYSNLGLITDRHYLDNDGEFNGEYENYDDYGKLSNVQLYKAGENYGEYVVDSNGKKTHEFLFKAGEEKVSKSFYSSLEHVDYTLKNGEIEGEYKSFSNNKLQVFGHFVNGQRHGVWTWKSPLDTVSTISNYELGVREGIQKTFTLDGKPYIEYTMMNDNEEGKFKKYYYNGNIYFETNYLEGTEHGLKTFYGINGEKILQIVVDNGDYITCITNSLNKELSDTIPVVNGNVKLVGKYKSGKKAIEFTLKDGLYEGAYVVYNAEEKPMIESNNKNGDLHGERNYYYLNGKLYVKERFIDDNFNGDTELYRENGTKKASISYVNDSLNGEMKLFDNTGKLIETRTYHNNILMNVKKI